MVDSRMRVAALVLALALVRPASAAEASPEAGAAPSLEERLKALEDRVRALEQENAELRKDVSQQGADIAPKPEQPTVTLAAGKEQALKVGGLLQVQAEAGGRGDARWTDDHDRLFLRRARVNVSGRFLDALEWKTEVELAGSLASATGLRGQLTDGYLAWKRSERLEIRAGQFKVPFGYEALAHDARLAFPERTLGSDRLTLGRQLGAQLSGSEAAGRFTWSAGGFDGTAANGSGNDDDRFLLAARAAGRLASWRTRKKESTWSLGASAFRSTDRAVGYAPEFEFDSTPGQGGNDNVFAGRRTGFGLDTQVVAGPVELSSEWLDGRFDPEDGMPSGRLRSRALMAQVAVTTAAGKLAPAVRWDAFDPDRRSSGDDTRTWTLGLAWLIKGQDLKFQADWMDVHAPDPIGSDGKLLLRMQVAF
jgi:phosphate-selective porin